MFLTLRRTTVPTVKQLSLDITRFFTDANIQACYSGNLKENIFAQSSISEIHIIEIKVPISVQKND